MKNNAKNKIIATALLLSLALASACQKPAAENPGGNGGTPAPGAQIAFENVYTSTPLPMPASLDGSNSSISGVAYSGGRVYCSGYVSVAAEDEEGGEIYTQKLVSFPLDGGDEIIHWEQTTEESGADALVHDYISLSQFDADAEGNLWLVVQATHIDETDRLNPVYEDKRLLIKQAPDGTVLAELDLSAPENGELNVYYFQSMALDGAGNIYLHAQDGVYVFSAEGKYAFSVKEDSGGGYISGMAAANTGEVIYVQMSQSDGSYSFKTIDFGAKAAGTTVKYSGAHYFNDIFSGTGDYAFYYTYQNGLYGMKLGAAPESALIINFINSDISNTGQEFLPMDDGRFIASISEYGRNGSSTTLTLLTANPDASLAGKTVLILGALYADTSPIMKFNKSHGDIRIIVKDYSEYNTQDDYTRGETQLDLDILSGRAPDVIMLNRQVTKYASKGALAELSPFLESGKHGVQRENLFENILTADSPDGDVYRIVPRFTVTTLVGKSSIFGTEESVTTAELAEIADARPDAAIMTDTTASSWLGDAMWLGMNSFIDWESGQCAFNSREFIDTLNFSKRFPKEIDYNARYGDQASSMEYQNDMETAYSEERVLLYRGTVYGPRVARDMDYVFGEKTTLLGYPAAGGNGNIIMGYGGAYAIAASSPNKDAAWEFICSVINYESEDGFGGFNGISIDRREFEDAMREEMIPLEERDFTDGIDVMKPHSGGGMSGWMLYSPEDIDKTDPFFENYAITEEQAQRALRAVEGASVFSAYDEQISKIIMEEAEAFWAGAKSAEETANVIQSRVQIYVSEGM
ncbi:MAG: extracellular solute-binding protein [Oscillospiraceae bacterium]|nr:extracellular solute-binding protein [Oscillospiraceae bacterium]